MHIGFLPVGTIVAIKKKGDKAPIRGIVRGYDMGHTKYRLDVSIYSTPDSAFTDTAGWWGFPSEVWPWETTRDITLHVSDHDMIQMRLIDTPTETTGVIERGLDHPSERNGWSQFTDGRPDPFKVSVAAIESLVLAHACAGVDVVRAAYVHGITTAYEALDKEWGD